MAARINHIATMSTNPMAIGTMYESIFGLNFDNSPKPANYGEVLTDGNVNLNLHHRLPGQRLGLDHFGVCLLYTSPSPRDLSTSRMPSSA